MSHELDHPDPVHEEEKSDEVEDPEVVEHGLEPESVAILEHDPLETYGEHSVELFSQKEHDEEHLW